MNQREQGRGANYQYGVKRRDFNRAAHTARLARVPSSAQLRRARPNYRAYLSEPWGGCLCPVAEGRASCRQSSPLSAPSNGAWSPLLAERKQLFVGCPSFDHSQFALPTENRLFRARDRWFESISLQRRVLCEPDFQCREDTSAGQLAGRSAFSITSVRGSRENSHCFDAAVGPSQSAAYDWAHLRPQWLSVAIGRPFVRLQVGSGLTNSAPKYTVILSGTYRFGSAGALSLINWPKRVR